MKQNCWEVMGCGREVGGENIHESGICPANIEKSLDGIHGGKNAGRACWVVAGTLCGSKVQGTFAEKTGNCLRCEFFRSVQKEEGRSLAKITELLDKKWAGTELH